MTVHIPHTNSTGRKVKVIPSWDYETDCAREESLLSRRIWLESSKPDVGVDYDNMKRCRASYHYLLRSLKAKIGVHVKQSVSKKFVRICFSPTTGIIGKMLKLFARKISTLFQ